MLFELTSIETIKELLKKHNAKPEKYLGQHFILSKNALKKITDAAEIGKTDTVIEVGPGLGTLTKELVKTGAKVIAIEKDSLMMSILKETMANYKNIKVIQADARQLLVSDTNNSIIGVGHQYGYQYKIVANLPYNVATFLIRQLLELKNPPKSMVLMIQKEVAQRIIASPPHSNLLAASVQFYASTEIIDYVKKESFWPRPKVNAAIIKIIPKKKPPQKTQNAFFAAVKAGFSQPRKQLLNNLSKKLKVPREKLISIFKDLNISEKARAENLSLKQWQNLASYLSTIQLIATRL